MTPETAQNIAIAGLQYLAGDEVQLSRFVALSGISVEEIRQNASSEGFLVGILDYFLSDEATLIAFAANEGIQPEDIQKAKFALAPEQFSEF